MKPCATFEKQTTVVTTKIAELDTCSYKVTQKNGPHKEVETPWVVIIQDFESQTLEKLCTYIDDTQ